MEIPAEFTSTRIKNKGYASAHQVLEVTPSNTYNKDITNEIIKFQFKTQDFIDPYEIYFDIVIEADPAQIGTGVSLLLDGSSDQLFEQIQIYSNNRHIETIRNLDEIMQIINSTSFDPDNRSARSYMGFGRQTNDGCTGQQPSDAQSWGHASITMLTSSSYSAMAFPRGYIPTKNITHACDVVTGRHYAQVSGIESGIGAAPTSDNQTFYQNPQLNQNLLPGLPLNSSLNQAGLAGTLLFDAAGTTAAKQNNLRNLICRKGSRAEMASAVKGSVLGVQGMQNQALYNRIDTTDPNNPVLIGFQAGTNGYVAPDTNNIMMNHRFGYQQFYSPQTSQHFCQSINPTFGCSYLYQGAIQDIPVVTNRKRFYCRLNSGVIGSLLPEHKLLPGSSFGQIEIQVRLNPYAFFLSGLDHQADYVDLSQGLVDLTPYMGQRKWTVENIKLMVNTYQYDKQFTQQLANQVSQGITLKSNGFEFSQQNSVADTRSLQGSWQIHSSIQSLKAIYIYFLSDDYLRYATCRKHFRLSGNVTSIQLKMGSDYYPRRAIEGHAGNPFLPMNETKLDNMEFIIWYQKAMGIFNMPHIYSAINPVNFAINTRSYVPELEATTQPNYKDHMLWGQTGLEEQRYVGQAIYPFVFESHPFQPSSLQGIDASVYNPFDILIKTDQVNYFDRPVTMNVLMAFNTEIRIDANEVTTFGYF